MQTIIPDISKQIYKEELLNVLEGKYSTLGPLWVNNQMEWMNGIYSAFKDHDKFLIIIFLLKRTLDFYSRSFVRLNYEQFYKKDRVEIGKFNISEISTELNIPKESARRKINELEALGVIKKIKKRIIIDRSSFRHIKPENTIKRTARFLATLSSLCVEQKIIRNKLTSSNLEIIIKDNFSYMWKIYYEMQIPMLLKYKKIFNDLEAFHIFGSCVVNQHLNIEQKNEFKTSREDYIKSMLSQKIQGINAMSISDITAIPRATVIRKLKKLIAKDRLAIDEKKHYRLTGNFAKQLLPIQKIVLDRLANFSSKVFNSIEISSKNKT